MVSRASQEARGPSTGPRRTWVFLQIWGAAVWLSVSHYSWTRPSCFCPIFVCVFMAHFGWLILAHRGAQMAVLNLRLIQCWSQEVGVPCCPQFWCLLNLIFSGLKRKQRLKTLWSNVDFLLFLFIPKLPCTVLSSVLWKGLKVKGEKDK